VIQRSLFQSVDVAGFDYKEELLSTAEEQGFIRRFATLPFQPLAFHGYRGNRRIVSYGWRYDYSSERLRIAEAIPVFLDSLKQVAADFSGVPQESFAHALITEYAPGAGIGWHRDKPMFREVVALSFAAPCLLRFRRRLDNGWQRQTVEVAARAGYVLRGDARHLWEHSIPQMSALRYSVTFRSLEKGAFTDLNHGMPPE
jgi:alkylated DNA repair dioxygenase AlkB